MRKIKVAHIGMNDYSHSAEIFGTAKQNPEYFEIAGYVLPENEREKFPHRMHVFDGYTELTLQEVLSDPTIEAVFVETEEIYLTKYAQMAADHHKHIHMEKPGGTDLKAFEKLISTVKENGIVFHTGYMYRYNPLIQQTLADVKAGVYGDILSVEAQMNCYHNEALRSWLTTFKGGMMFFLGCHLIDLVLQFRGFPEKIHTFNKSSGTLNVPAEDSTMCVFEYPNGTSFVKTTDYELGGFERRQLIVSGTKKAIEIKPIEVLDPTDATVICSEYSTCDTTAWIGRSGVSKTEPFNRYESMMKHFCSYVCGDADNPYTADYELALYKTILKCCE